MLSVNIHGILKEIEKQNKGQYSHLLQLQVSSSFLNIRILPHTLLFLPD